MNNSLPRKVNKINVVHAVGIKTKSHGVVFDDIETWVLFNRQTEKTYGVLGKDNDTILPLDDDNLR